MPAHVFSRVAFSRLLLVALAPMTLATACGDDARDDDSHDASLDVVEDATADVSDDGSGDDARPDAAEVDAADGAETDADDVESDVAEPCVELADGTCVVETFANPPVAVPDENGVYQLSLEATEVVLDGERHCVRAYNQSFVGPTIDTPAREAGEQRQVRVNLANRLDDHDYRSLSGDTCLCTDGDGASCVPAHVHDRCVEPDESCVCRNGDGDVCEHMFDFNVTNLHAHGSHIRPDYARGGESCTPSTDGDIVFECRECSQNVCDPDRSDDTCYNADNVLNAVHPSTGAQYRWDIDEDGTHHAGLQWYHPHIHGTTAIQVASGAAGAWIVRGEIDALDGVADARERVILFSTAPLASGGGFEPLDEGVACSEETLTFNNFFTLGDTSALQANLINGVRRPRLVTPPDQVERWRILHAGFLDEVFLGFFRGTDSNCTAFSTDESDTIELVQIARDGLILPQSFEHPYLFLSPGYRVEAMLGGEGRLNDGETWCLVAARFLQPRDTDQFGEFGQEPTAPVEPPTPEQILARFESDGDVVAILNVAANAGEPTETQLPDFDAIAALAPDLALGGEDIEQLCADAAAVAPSSEVDQLAVLQVGAGTFDEPDPCDCEAYNVNCNNFEYTDRTRYPFDRDLVLDAVEHWRVGASFDGHPFHIHINPFVVCPNDNIFDPLPFAHWRDTYLVNVGRQVDIITQNRMFTGPYVFHCHKLTHEDHGMMELIRVCDPETDATCGENAWNQCDADDLQCLKALEATRCYVDASSPAEVLACVTLLGGPAGICGPNGCADDDDCGPVEACVENLCVPAPR